MIIQTSFLKIKLSQEQLFMLSVLVVNGGNYFYNLVLGRILGPAKFADAAVLITFLLVLSFLAMTFQLVTAKFSVTFDNETFRNFVPKLYKNAVFTGIGFGVLIIIFASQLQKLLNTSSSSMFVIFGIGVPLYFLMSINRGVFQGKKEFKLLSITYQAEMLSRLVITLLLLFLFNIQSSLVIAVGILFSFGFGLFPFKSIPLKKNGIIKTAQSKNVRNFFIVTAFYELTQIVINNSDILLVKHYFESYDAGLYASLALIGRIVYFIAWMFVMLLLPTVIQHQKDGKTTAPILFRYVAYIVVIASIIVIVCALFPESAIKLLFGESYLAMAPLLWKYSFATGLFAISNIFAYYYLSLEKYAPVVISGVFGMFQMTLVVLFHESLGQVVYMQILAMILLLIIQIIFFIFDTRMSNKCFSTNS